MNNDSDYIIQYLEKHYDPDMSGYKLFEELKNVLGFGENIIKYTLTNWLIEKGVDIDDNYFKEVYQLTINYDNVENLEKGHGIDINSELQNAFITDLTKNITEDLADKILVLNVRTKLGDEIKEKITRTILKDFINTGFTINSGNI